VWRWWCASPGCFDSHGLVLLLLIRYERSTNKARKNLPYENWLMGQTRLESSFSKVKKLPETDNFSRCFSGGRMPSPKD
jgi:hypothetical protein